MRDEFTTLPETWDRILSTDIDCSWTWKPFATVAAVEAGVERFDKAWASARGIILQTFATDESASVQNTMYKMCEQILDTVPEADKAGFSLPNKHYFEIGECIFNSSFTLPLRLRGVVANTISPDLSWHNGVKNTGKDAEVYAPQSGPNGLIKCEVARDVSTVVSR